MASDIITETEDEMVKVAVLAILPANAVTVDERVIYFACVTSRLVVYGLANEVPVNAQDGDFFPVKIVVAKSQVEQDGVFSISVQTVV